MYDTFKVAAKLLYDAVIYMFTRRPVLRSRKSFNFTTFPKIRNCFSDGNSVHQNLGQTTVCLLFLLLTRFAEIFSLVKQ